MTQLDILFDLLTQLVAILTRHGHVAQHNVRLFGPHLFEGRIGIETGYQAIILREEHSHVVDDLGVVVDDEDGGTTVVIG